MQLPDWVKPTYSGETYGLGPLVDHVVISLLLLTVASKMPNQGRDEVQATAAAKEAKKKMKKMKRVSVCIIYIVGSGKPRHVPLP